MKISCNLHTHTSFCDGADSAEKMVEGAIACGCTTLGFSGHSCLERENHWTMSRETQTEYINEVLRLREKYKDSIEILLGIEQDYDSDAPQYPFDYVIGSVHAVEKNGLLFDVDSTPESFNYILNELYQGNSSELIKDYYSRVANVVDVTNCDIIGHFDLVTKFNERLGFVDTDSKQYRSLALEALDALIEKNKIFEINTGAISRGWRKMPYPQDFLLKRLAEKKANVILSSDSHSKDTVLYFFDEAIEYAKSCGVGELCIYKNKKFEKIKI